MSIDKLSGYNDNDFFLIHTSCSLYMRVESR